MERFFLDINVRYTSSGATYQARCPGHQQVASATMGPEAAARRLAERLYPATRVLSAECLKDGGHTETGAWRCHLEWLGA